MATKSKTGSPSLPVWSGSFGHWNPHIIRRPLNEIPKRRSLGAAEETEAPLMVEFRDNYLKACELLRAIPGTRELFKEGVPLCPCLIPQMSPLKVDDISLAKVGGLPDLRRNFSYGYRKRLKQYYESTGMKAEAKKVKTEKDEVEGLWPRCGTCHQFMSFIGQFDLGDYWEAMHRLTCEGDGYGNFSYSSFGLSEDHKHISFWRESMELMFWACPNAGEHFGSQNFDAAIWKETHPIYDAETRRILKEKEPDPEVVAKSRAEATEVAQNFIDKHKIKSLIKKKRQITGLLMRFELDWGIEPWHRVPYKLEEKLEKVQTDHPDIFAYKHGRSFKLFGEPESQQEEMRPFSQGYRSKTPQRMSPVLCWDDDEHDFTYQMYADTCRFDGEGRNRMQGKIDGSCT